MENKVVIFGGGNGASTLVSGLKQFPMDLTVVVSVCDDGKSTGKLRKEFDIPAVGDLRRVITVLSPSEPLITDLMNYRFDTTSDLDGHAVGNLMLTALCNITGSISKAIDSLSDILKLKGKVLALTDSNVVLMAEMDDGTVIEGEHNITEHNGKIKRIFYKEEPEISDNLIESIKEADEIVLSMGSLYTSVICNLLSKKVIKAIDASHAKILYVCNMMTQPGETDGFTASDHVKEINKYLGEKKVSGIVVNTGKVSRKIIKKYHTEEQKLPVVCDLDELKKMKLRILDDDYVAVENGSIRHNLMLLSLSVFSDVIRSNCD